MTVNAQIPHRAVAEAAGYPDAFAIGPTRRCSMCGLCKPQTEFHNSRTGQFSYCGDCRRAYDRRYYHERARAASTGYALSPSRFATIVVAAM